MATDKKPIIIGFAGQKQSGKSTAAEFVRISFPHLSIVEFSFATLLKKLCIDILGLNWYQCFGADAAKETLTEYLWEDVDEDYRIRHGGGNVKSGHMSAREVMEIQAEIQRRIFCKDIWIRLALRQLELSKDSIDVALFSDLRHTNEVDRISKEGYIVYLAKRTNTRNSDAETQILSVDWNNTPNSFVLDNTNMTIEEKNAALLDIVRNQIGVA